MCVMIRRNYKQRQVVSNQHVSEENALAKLQNKSNFEVELYATEGKVSKSSDDSTIADHLQTMQWIDDESISMKVAKTDRTIKVRF